MKILNALIKCIILSNKNKITLNYVCMSQEDSRNDGLYKTGDQEILKIMLIFKIIHLNSLFKALHQYHFVKVDVLVWKLVSTRATLNSSSHTHLLLSHGPVWYGCYCHLPIFLHILSSRAALFPSRYSQQHGKDSREGKSLLQTPAASLHSISKSRDGGAWLQGLPAVFPSVRKGPGGSWGFPGGSMCYAFNFGVVSQCDLKSVHSQVCGILF